MSNQNQSMPSIDRQNALNDSKATEFYSQGVAAWFNTALERDKSLLTLSVAGVGVLVSMTQIAVDSIGSLLLYAGALLAFIFCLFFVLIIFKQNKKHIQDVFNGQATEDPLLEFLDSGAIFSFLIAILLCVTLGIYSAVAAYNDKESKMTKERAKDASLSIEKCIIANNPTPLTTPVRHHLGDSYNGIANLQNSFTGMSQLQGQSQSQTTQQTTASQSQPTSAQNSSSGATSK